MEEGVESGERGVRGTGNSVWREGGRVEKDNAVLDAEESGSELVFDWIFDWICVDLGGICGAGGSGLGCGYGEWVEGVESGVRVLWVEGLEDWRRKRKSPKKIVDQRESEIEWCFLS